MMNHTVCEGYGPHAGEVAEMDDPFITGQGYECGSDERMVLCESCATRRFEDS